MTNDLQPIDQYLSGLTLLHDELSASEVKAHALIQLTEKLICTAPPPDRNKCLKAFKLIKAIGTVIGDSKLKKSVSKTKTLLENVILGQLASEQLDNFSHAGKLFYPSSTTRYNVADRQELEKWVLQQLNEDPSMLSMFGNTLNAELIRAHQEKHQVEQVDSKTGETILMDGPPPPGVGSHTTTTLNMRNSK